jgi:patatin-related protein
VPDERSQSAEDLQPPADDLRDAQGERDADEIDADRQEIRIALVMTGGVSLAIWMGGVAAELDRMVRGDGVYGRLLDLVRSVARVDVIGGTSAGGVNGAFLAMAGAHGADMAILRSVWLELGSLGSMIRSPNERRPPSLLRGDGYFLTNLRLVLDRLAGAGPLTPADENPLHLTLTTTLMRGQHRVYQDDHGGRIHDLSHRGSFSFVRDDDWGRDDFAEPGVSARLALAARSTASFPGAFEPSFAPIGMDAGPDHPDMAGHADFAEGGFVLDGGVLSNKPIRQVLDILFHTQTEGSGRRVLAYVIPDPNLPRPTGEADEVAQAEIPPMPRVVATSMQIPRVESVVPELEAIQAHNQRVAGQRRLRESLFAPPRAVEPDELAAQVFPAYAGARRDYRLNWILDLLVRGLRSRPAAEEPAAERPRRGRGRASARAWDRAAVREALAEALTPRLPFAFPPAPESVDEWFWDIAGLKGAVGVASQPLRLAIAPGASDSASGPAGSSVAAARRDVRRALRAVGEVRRSLQRFRVREERHWSGVSVPRLRDALEGDREGRAERLAAWAEEALAGSPSQADQAELRRMASTVAAITRAAAPSLVELAGAEGSEPLRAVISSLTPAADARTEEPGRPDEPGATPLVDDRDVLRSILATVVVQTAFAGNEPVVEQVIELVQISAETANAFDARDTGLEKLAGLQLAHFGAFYKQSWRANDWMWGRLDAVGSLLRVALDPSRLRRLAAVDPSFADELMDGIREMLMSGSNDQTDTTAALRFDEDVVAAELTFLRDRSAPLPRSLNACIGALRARIQLEILREELPHVAAAVRADLLAGAADRATARRFLSRVAAGQPGAATGRGGRQMGLVRRPAGVRLPAVDADRRLDAEAAIEAFHACRVGAERIADEAGSPLYHRTVDAATAVGVRAAHRREAPSAPTGAGAPATPPSRRKRARQTVPVMPLVRGVAASSRTVFITMTVLVVLGATLLAVGLHGQVPNWPATALGAVFAILGLGLAALRTRWGVAVIAPAVACAVLLILSMTVPGDGFLQSGAFRLLALALLVLPLIAVDAVAVSRRFRAQAGHGAESAPDAHRGPEPAPDVRA